MQKITTHYSIKATGQILQSESKILVESLLFRMKLLWEKIFEIEYEAKISIGNALKKHDPLIEKLELRISDMQRDVLRLIIELHPFIDNDVLEEVNSVLAKTSV